MFRRGQSKRYRGGGSPFEPPSGFLPDYEDAVEEGGWAMLDGEAVFVVPSGEGERSGFRTITDEVTAEAAVRSLIEASYRAVRQEFLQREAAKAALSSGEGDQT